MTAAKKARVRATEVGAIMGVDDWQDPIDVWRAKMDPPKREPPSEQQEWGSALEGAILDQWRKRFDMEVIPAADTRTALSGRLSGRCDAIAVPLVSFALGTDTHPAREPGDPGPRLVEVKNVSERQLLKWKAEGVPLRYQYQAQAYMELYSMRLCTFVVLFGGNEMHEFHALRDEEMQAEMRKGINLFCGCVDNDIPPETPKTHRNYVREEGTSESLDEDDIATINALIVNRNLRKKLDDEAKRLNEALKEVVDSNQCLKLGKITIAQWSERTRKEAVQQAKTWRQFDIKPNTVLNRAIENFGLERGKAAQREAGGSEP